MEVRRLLLVAHPAERMYDLIEGAEHYPAFLPWCTSAVVTERSDAIVAADIGVDWHGVRIEFATRNLKRRPGWMGVRLARGPFRQFEGEWQLTPLGDEGCRIAFLLRYDFSSTVLSRVASPVFERITGTLADAFVARADALGAAIPVPLPVPSPVSAGAATTEGGIATAATRATPASTATDVAFAPSAARDAEDPAPPSPAAAGGGTPTTSVIPSNPTQDPP